jgi:hypothetical protein
MTAAVIRFPPRRASAVFVCEERAGDGWLVLARDHGWLHGDMAALVAAARPMSVEEIMKAAGFKNRHAADQMLSRMFKEMEISRSSRGMYEAKTEQPVRNV